MQWTLRSVQETYRRSKVLKGIKEFLKGWFIEGLIGWWSTRRTACRWVKAMEITNEFSIGCCNWWWGTHVRSRF
jgi:hypothetical protein